MPDIAGVKLSKAAHDKLVAAALESAGDLGLCGETINVLRDMGFEVAGDEATVILKVKVRDLEPGVNAESLPYHIFDVSLYSGEHPDAYVDDFEVVSVDFNKS